MDAFKKDYAILETAYGAKQWNKVNEVLPRLKIALTEWSFLVPSDANDDEAIQRAVLARDVLEKAAIAALMQNDIAGFERNAAQVKTYYTDYGDDLPESELEAPLVGLSLLNLLAHGRETEFHTELEKVPGSMREVVYIDHVVQMEQCLMEGRYNKVHAGRADVPHEYYTVFMDILMETIREEVASCVEQAYEGLDTGELRKMLMLDNHEETLNFAADHGWEISDDRGSVSFAANRVADAETVPSMKLIRETLHVAKEMERIV